MTTSTYMPDVKVEIAFNAGYATASGSRTWTDVSAYVELDKGISITHGRTDEFAAAEANRLSLTVDNSDGRFTPEYASGAYYPNVKLGRPIRVTVTHNAVTYTRFLGYIDEWPFEWVGSSNVSQAVISASSRITHLGLDAELRPMAVHEIIEDGPVAYWPMGEPAESVQAADEMGGNPLVPNIDPPVFGGEIGLHQDSSTGVTFSNTTGHYLKATLEPDQWMDDTSSKDVAIEVVLRGPMTGSGFMVKLLGDGDTGGINEMRLGVAATGLISLSISDDDSTTLMSTVNDGPWNDYTVEAPIYVCAVLHKDNTGKTQLSLYVSGDGVQSIVSASTYTFFFDRVHVGFHLDDTLAHLSLWNEPLVTGGVFTGYDAMFDRVQSTILGNAGETTADRFERIAGYANLPATEIDADGAIAIQAFELGGITALEAMRRIEEVEAGVLYDTPGNILTLASRDARYNTTPALTINAALQQLESGLQPRLDRSALINDITVSAPGATTRATDQASIDEYGLARTTLELAAYDPVEETYQAANWRIALYSEPHVRIPNAGIDLLPLSTSNIAAVMGVEIGDRIRLTGLPSQAPSSQLDQFIEGWSEQISKEAYEFEFNVSPTTGYDVWVLQDATYGPLDTYPLAY